MGTASAAAADDAAAVALAAAAVAEVAASPAFVVEITACAVLMTACAVLITACAVDVVALVDAALADAAPFAAWWSAEYEEPVTALSSARTAQSLAEPAATVVPSAYSFALYSDVSTAAPVVVAHSLLDPRLAVVVTSVPPTLQAFAL
tara:strand:+ start:82 stop:525 length:444 start_codon:yes stop_codon:yes gene_type:complete